MANGETILEDVLEEVVAKTSAKVLSLIQANELAAIGATLITGIRFSKSSFDELIETLQQADEDPAEKYRKYPLIHLVQDVTITRGVDVGLYGSGAVDIIFIHQTEQTYKIDDRDAKVFKPVLWPIYWEFLRQLKKSKWIFGSDAATGEFRHQVTKRAFWGNRKLEGSKLILNDFVDAIDVRGLGLKLNNSNC